MPDVNDKRRRTVDSALADLGGGLRGLQPQLWSENFTKKRSFFAIFRAATPPPPFRTELWTKVVMRGCNPLSKISGSAYVVLCCF